MDFLRGLDNSQTCFECQGEDAIRKLVDDFNAKLQAGDILVLFFLAPIPFYGGKGFSAQSSGRRWRDAVTKASVSVCVCVQKRPLCSLKVPLGSAKGSLCRDAMSSLEIVL